MSVVRAGGRRRGAAFVAAAGLVAAGLAGTTGRASADDPSPSLKILVQKGDLTAYSFGHGKYAYLSLPFLAEAVDGDLDLRVTRASGVGITPGDPGSYSSPLSVAQMIGGTSHALPDATVDEDYWGGLEDFWHVAVTDENGKSVADQDQSFCPNTYEPQRIDPDSASSNAYPGECSAPTFARGARWGISSGWASGLADDYDGFGIAFKGKVGKTFTVTVSVNPAYQSLLGSNDTSKSAVVTVTKAPKYGGYFAATKHSTRAGIAAAGTSSRRAHHKAAAGPKVSPQSVPTVADPDDSVLPDLQALPSSDISVSKSHKKWYLNFGATVWVGGNSRMDIEGFRDDDAHPDVMTAYQYFYDGDDAVGKQQVGTLEFDRRKGHNHWHLEYFAAYDLVSSPTGDGQRSEKQSFCLAPTDPVDLTLPNADFLAESEDLGSSCGADNATWIRETLPVGWGDTYGQYKGGQAFDLTGMVPGTYYIRIAANPPVGTATQGALKETDYTNDVSLRKVVLSKAHGKWKVCVPSVDGLDPEGSGHC